MTDLAWVRLDVALAIHDEQLAEHGGSPGLRDEGLLDSALTRPQNLAAYGDPGASELAAAYAFGITRNHPFVDGNKRTALVIAELFLALNGHELAAGDAECVVIMSELAAGDIDETELVAWFRRHIQPQDDA